jgi:hypothetical protein
MFGNWLSVLIFVFKGLCYVVLLYYFVKALFVTVALPDPDKRFREALAVTYLVAAAWFTGAAIGVIPSFTQHCIESTGNLVVYMPELVLKLIAVAGAVILTAFICNFARALYMLKSLDHAMFEPIPEWGRQWRMSSTRTRLLEFGVRLVAAVLFLLLEYALKSVGQPHDGNHLTGPDEQVTNPFATPGLIGIFLYIVLAIWWCVARRVAGDEMRIRQLLFYGAGLLNSIILTVYARATSELFAWIVVLSAVVSMGGSFFMIGMVVREIVKGGFSGWTAPGQQASTSH